MGGRGPRRGHTTAHRRRIVGDPRAPHVALGELGANPGLDRGVRPRPGRLTMKAIIAAPVPA
jgi:hypothetical protein